MIFATVGTSAIPFDRLLLALDRLEPGEELRVQHGPSAVRPRGAASYGFMPYGELAEQMRLARAVVAHGGVGSILTALANGRRPIVMPRERARGEAVDDHQLVLARRLAEAGTVALVRTADELAEALAGDGLRTAPASGSGAEDGLAGDLAGYLRSRLAPTDGGTA